VLTTADLDALIVDIEAEMSRIIANAEDERTRPLYDMVRYHVGLDQGSARGKRIRPLLGLLAYQSISGDYERALPGAAAVELGHNFSLVHDDIEDNGTERRNRPALWIAQGVPQAINAGDTLFSLSRLALHRLEEMGYPPAKILQLMRLYDDTCLALCEGQFMDIWTSEHDEWISVDYYFDMIGRKTASLIAGAIQAAAMLATEDTSIVAAYRGFGWAVGLAFQLNDDLLGIWGDEAVTGKEPSDIATRKKTLPAIYAMEHAGPDDRARLREIFAVEHPSAADVDEALGILERTGAQEYVRERARSYRDEALAQLESVGVVDGVAMDRLRLIVVSAIAA
jgi:geranylgeranyl diphosphate synthase type I